MLTMFNNIKTIFRAAAAFGAVAFGALVNLFLVKAALENPGPGEGLPGTSSPVDSTSKSADEIRPGVTSLCSLAARKPTGTQPPVADQAQSGVSTMSTSRNGQERRAKKVAEAHEVVLEKSSPAGLLVTVLAVVACAPIVLAGASFLCITIIPIVLVSATLFRGPRTVMAKALATTGHLFKDRAAVGATSVANLISAQWHRLVSFLAHTIAAVASAGLGLKARSGAAASLFVQSFFELCQRLRVFLANAFVASTPACVADHQAKVSVAEGLPTTSSSDSSGAISKLADEIRPGVVSSCSLTALKPTGNPPCFADQAQASVSQKTRPRKKIEKSQARQEKKAARAKTVGLLIAVLAVVACGPIILVCGASFLCNDRPHCSRLGRPFPGTSYGHGPGLRDGKPASPQASAADQAKVSAPKIWVPRKKIPPQRRKAKKVAGAHEKQLESSSSIGHLVKALVAIPSTKDVVLCASFVGIAIVPVAIVSVALFRAPRTLIVQKVAAGASSIVHWTCALCRGLWSISALASTAIKSAGVRLNTWAAVGASSIVHWTCALCNGLWSVSALASTAIKSAGLRLKNWAASSIVHSTCALCNGLWSISALAGAAIKKMASQARQEKKSARAKKVAGDHGTSPVGLLATALVAIAGAPIVLVGACFLGITILPVALVSAALFRVPRAALAKTINNLFLRLKTWVAARASAVINSIFVLCLCLRSFSVWAIETFAGACHWLKARAAAGASAAVNSIFALCLCLWNYSVRAVETLAGACHYWLKARAAAGAFSVVLWTCSLCTGLWSHSALAVETLAGACYWLKARAAAGASAAVNLIFALCLCLWNYSVRAVETLAGACHYWLKARAAAGAFSVVLWTCSLCTGLWSLSALAVETLAGACHWLKARAAAGASSIVLWTCALCTGLWSHSALAFAAIKRRGVWAPLSDAASCDPSSNAASCDVRATNRSKENASVAAFLAREQRDRDGCRIRSQTVDKATPSHCLCF
ncbi:hypothetical protein ACHAXT_009749 [Thalassiosira profunda]